MDVRVCGSHPTHTLWPSIHGCIGAHHLKHAFAPGAGNNGVREAAQRCGRHVCIADYIDAAGRVDHPRARVLQHHLNRAWHPPCMPMHFIITESSMACSKPPRVNAALPYLEVR